MQFVRLEDADLDYAVVFLLDVLEDREIVNLDVLLDVDLGQLFWVSLLDLGLGILDVVSQVLEIFADLCGIGTLVNFLVRQPKVIPQRPRIIPRIHVQYNPFNIRNTL